MTWNMLVTQQLIYLLRHEVEQLGRSPLWFSLTNKAWVKPSCWLYPNEPVSSGEAQWRCWELMVRWCGSYPEVGCSINCLYGGVLCGMHRAGLEPSSQCGCAQSLRIHSFHSQSWWSHSALFPFLAMLVMRVGGIGTLFCVLFLSLEAIHGVCKGNTLARHQNIPSQ